MRWQYGFWPLRNIIKKTVEDNSVFKYGIKRYLQKLENIQRENQDLILLGGIESAPFYYWEAGPFANNFSIINWHKHILVIGLNKVEDYKGLPVIGNNQALVIPRKFKDIFKLWPILILLVGILCLRKRRFDYRDLSNRQLGPYSRIWQSFGIFLAIIGLLFLFNNYYFCDFKFNQYQGDLGVMPYQNFIDYVNQRGGMTFWAHPEAEYIQKMGRVNIETREHTGDLLKTHDYTGFAIFYEGYNSVGIAGGIWDKVLKEYCQGKRGNAVWAIGGLSFDSTGNLSQYLKDLRTVFLISELTRDEVLRALKEGRMYVIRGKDASRFVLDKFIIRDTESGKERIAGQEIELEGRLQVEIKGHFLNGQNQPFKIKLIKNGSIINTIETTTPFDVSYQEENNGNDSKIYYRAQVESDGVLLVTNPIFVKQKINK
jgi:hypothetical protein